ncbi:hypothetical protein CONLIGDRAFT_675788 [Coniochaeta ligniaria NRRL 30616]|uniref:Uncharacterized protein n=1 Tax=Coniochaeta ligniaria NRRL 30616 TaxID=1408157 RepID=A0A1J7JXK7_9PEZI|nr:hypothetical protein CONLIGDRAFT_675788 [Coniochaeta ligniaria NRRL 30616]
MTSNTANTMDGSTAQAQDSYATKDYKITLRICANPATLDSTKDWLLEMEFRCHDLLRIMKEGLFWTSSNVVPGRGWLGNTRGSYAKHLSKQRVWELRDFADQEESQCRWVATATLYGHSWKFLADFRLHSLLRRNIGSCWAVNKMGDCVFVYNRSPDQPNCNCFDDKLHPSHGSWWFWPMEAILDYDTLTTLSCRDGEKTNTETNTNADTSTGTQAQTEGGSWSLI